MFLRTSPGTMRRVLPLLVAASAVGLSAAFSVPGVLPKVGHVSSQISSKQAWGQASRQLRAAGLRDSRRASAPSVSMQLAGFAAQTLGASQSATVQRLQQHLNMEQKDYPAQMGFDSFTVGDAQGTCLGFEAPGKSNVAWCSSLNINGPNSCLSALTTWCGPLAEVPHMVTRTFVAPDRVDLFIDFRPRAYAAYETRKEDGSYPEPDSREWFTQKAARDGFAELFFTPDAEAWAASLYSVPGAAPKPRPTDQEDMLSRGPLTVDISLPPTEDSVALCARATADAAAMWQSWMDTCPPLPAGMKVTSTYARDTKLRAQLFGVMVNYYSSIYGDQGRNVAAVDAGPLDEAYVGGAS